MQTDEVKTPAIRSGDTVKHRPTGETWTVAYVDGDYLAWVGWPYGTAKISDCDLIAQDSDADRIKLLKLIASSKTEGHDRRPQMAREEMERIAAEAMPGTTFHDNFAKLTRERDEIAAEMSRLSAAWGALQENVRRIEAQRREACIEILDRAYAP